MRKRICSKLLVMVVLGMLCALVVSEVAQAEIQLTDCFSVTGFLRHELGIHTGVRNPNNAGQDNYDFSLSRSWFQTEWTYNPTDKFKAFSKIRLMWDQTSNIDSELSTYDPYPLDVNKSDWTLMKSSDDHFSAEVWELYGDVTLGNLWLRLGRQQIAWGEMIGTRVLDVINPLDFSRNFIFDPEEFENIRIPAWMMRGRYDFGVVGNWLRDFSIEGFLNPGDVVPNITADSGAPFAMLPTFPPIVNINEKDRRWNAEYGVRAGGMVGDFYLTLNYLYLYADDFYMDLDGIQFNPFMVNVNAEYPSMNIYGLTGNYFMAPVNTVVTVEAAWTPDQPYQDASAPGALGIKDQGTLNYSVRLMRQTFVFPRPTSAMMIQLQFQQIIREGNEDKIAGPLGSEIDHTDEFIFLLLDQMYHYNTYGTTMQMGYDLDGAWMFKPMVKYNHRNQWYVDLYYVHLAGSEDRPGRFASIKWMDEVVCRFTYQF